MDLKFYFSLFLRRIHWFFLFLVVGSALGLTLAKVLPPVFVANARLLVESEQIPGELAASTVRTEATEQLEIIQQRILTRATLVELANRLGVYEATGARPPMDTDSLVEDMRKRIGIVTTGGAIPRGPARATIVSVSFEAPTAHLAATVTNELVTLILREDVTMRTRVARQTLEFFEQEVDRLDKELAERGASITVFKESNQSALPDSLEFRRSQQAANQERLLQLEREATALRDQRSRMVSLNDTLGPQLATSGREQTPEQQQLQQMRDQLSAQLAVLSSSNPRIKLLEAQIASLENVVEEQLSRGAVSAEGAPMTAYDVQLAEIDGRLEFIESQKQQISAELANLEDSIKKTPANAIQLDTLERDYANLRAQYDEAAANKARAETGDVIEALSKGQKISVIEQAVTPNEPEKPNRLLIAAGGISGGALLGFGFIALLEAFNRGIRRPVELTTKLGITPFATLPFYRTRGDIIRRRAIIWGVLFFFMVSIPLALWTLDTYYAPLDQLFDRLTQQFALAPRSAQPRA